MHVSRNVQTTECILVSVSFMFLVVYSRAAKPMHGNHEMRSFWWPNAAKTIACEAFCEPVLLKPCFLLSSGGPIVSQSLRLLWFLDLSVKSNFDGNKTVNGTVATATFAQHMPQPSESNAQKPLRM